MKVQCSIGHRLFVLVELVIDREKVLFSHESVTTRASDCEGYVRNLDASPFATR